MRLIGQGLPSALRGTMLFPQEREFGRLGFTRAAVGLGLIKEFRDCHHYPFHALRNSAELLLNDAQQFGT